MAGSSDRLLHDATTMLVACNLRILRDHSVIDELTIDRFPRLQDLLQHVIAVNILGQQPDLVL